MLASYSEGRAEVQLHLLPANTSRGQHFEARIVSGTILYSGMQGAFCK